MNEIEAVPQSCPRLEAGQQRGSLLTGDGLPPIWSADQLASNHELKFPEELVQGLIHAGTKSFVVGASKSGKSWLTLSLGMSVAAGIPWLGFKTVQGRVLYVNFELMEAALAERIRMLRAGLLEENAELKLDEFQIENMRGCSISFPEYLEKLIRRLEGQDYSLIIIDPFYKGMVGRDENSASAVNPICAALDRLADQTGAAILLVHHYSKGNQGNKPLIDRLVGSGVTARDADTVITLTEHQAPDCLTMEFVLRNFLAQPGLVLERQIPVFVIREDLEASPQAKDEAAKADLSKVLMGLLGAAELTTSEWEAKARVGYGISRASFFRHKSKLVAEEKVVLDPATKVWRVAAVET